MGTGGGSGFRVLPYVWLIRKAGNGGFVRKCGAGRDSNSKQTDVRVRNSLNAKVPVVCSTSG